MCGGKTWEGAGFWPLWVFAGAGLGLLGCQGRLLGQPASTCGRYTSGGMGVKVFGDCERVEFCGDHFGGYTCIDAETRTGTISHAVDCLVFIVPYTPACLDGQGNR